VSAVRVDGKPQAKQRPRVGRGGRVYTPKETRDYEQLVAAAWRAAGGPCLPKGTAAEVTIHVYRDRVEVSVEVADGLPATARADLDNLAKSVLDGLNGVAFDDDRQIAKLTVVRCP
jgi:crossover junction endodeoxyribonuclease RusA